jgi:putative ABC transport system ATP-binding protein
MIDGAGSRASRARSLDLLDRVGLGHRASHFPAELSGGEMQRAAVARAIVNDPAIVLADEPTGNLDSQNGEQVMNLLAELNREHAITIILATHSEEAARFTKRTIRMRDGRIERDQENSPKA